MAQNHLDKLFLAANGLSSAVARARQINSSTASMLASPLRLSHADHHSSKAVLLVPVYRPTQRQLRIAAALAHAAPAFALSTCVSGAPLCCSSAVNAAQCCATVLPTGNGYYCHGIVSCIIAAGDTVIAGSADANISVMGIDCKALSLRRTLFGHTHAVASLALCPRSSLLFSASLDGSVRGWSWPSLHFVKLDGRVLLFEAQEDDANVSLRQVSDVKVGEGAIMSLFWSTDSRAATADGSHPAAYSTHCLAVTESGLLVVFDSPRTCGARWTHRSMKVLPEGTMAASVFQLGGRMQLAACTDVGSLYIVKCT